MLETMIGFTIKKAFFDFWDNLFRIVLMNLGFILLLGIPVFVPYWLYPLGTAASAAAFIIGVLVIFVYAGAVSLMARDISDYLQPGFADFISYVKDSWLSSLLFGLLVLAHIAVLMTAFPVYASMKNIFGLGAMVFIFWVSVIWLAASQYFFPLRARLDRSFGKDIKKCFLLFFDNTGFTFVLGLGTVFIGVISSFTAFLLPGFAAVLLWLQVSFKLRLMKYDYLEANPDADRKKIPWETLLIDEEERVGKRTLKGMIFPWKE
jgi:uncharacterized membrane protein YesL